MSPYSASPAVTAGGGGGLVLVRLLSARFGAADTCETAYLCWEP